jgi:ribose transport system ATP-binding protein
LRNGKNLVTSDIQDISDEEIIDGIVGHHTESLSKTAHRKGLSGAALLQMKNVSSNNGIKNISLSVHEGEVVGLAGLMGAGRTEVTRVLFGIDRLSSGEIEIGGEKFIPKSPHDAIMRSMALVPEDRRKQGLVVSHSVKENLVLTKFKECMQLGLLSEKKISELALSLIRTFSIKVDSPNAPSSRLSGGNQQKIVIAKWLGMNPNLLIMDEPTAGIDIGTKQEVLAEVSSFAESGKGVLFISSELAEMVAVCDRYILMKKGRVVGEVDASEISDEADLQLAIQHAGTLESR